MLWDAVLLKHRVYKCHPHTKRNNMQIPQYIFKYERFSAVHSFAKFIRPPPGNWKAARAACMDELASGGSYCSCCLAPDSGVFFSSYSFNLRLTLVSPFARMLTWWDAASPAGEGSREGEFFFTNDRSLQGLQPMFPCEWARFLVPLPKEMCCPNWMQSKSSRRPAGAGKAVGWDGSPGSKGQSPACLPAGV